MTSREKALGATVAVGGLLWCATLGLSRYQDAREQNVNQQIEAERALSEARAAVTRGQNARRQLNQWNRRSLPTDAAVAESLYQDWLRGRVTEVGLEVVELTDKTASARTPNFGALSFEVRARGSLGDFTKFLYQFYSAIHLHRISDATISGVDVGQKLDITMTIDALILPGCERTDRLAADEPQPMPAELDEYRSRIVDRNLFAVHTPQAGGEGSADTAAAAAKITGMTYGLGGWVMTVHVAEGDDVRVFQQGDAVEFGAFKGTVIEIDGRRAIVETDKGRFEIRLGQSFGEATALQAPAA
ncbi:MAG: hypothetical protein DCC67_13375 [Planctomycetota bacterium]|nr:MAG: hypothetical protein DCC67_13375 [Planctomycetota bacterium]